MTTHNKLISLNCKDGVKQNGDFNSNILFNFIDIIKRDINTLYFSVYIQSAEIPYSFYNVSENYNIIYYNVEGNNYTITIPEGNYTAKTFINEFNSQFANGGHNKTATLSISSVNGRFNLKPSDDSFTITIFNNITTAQHILGMSNANITFSFNSGNGVNFDFPANLLGTTKINIYSENLACSNLSSYHLGNSNLIECISVNSGTFELINYTSSTRRESIINTLTLHQIDIQLKDENNNFIDFNGLNWSISLVITEYFDTNLIKPLKNFQGFFDKKKVLLEELKNKKKEQKEKLDPTLEFLLDK